MYENGSNELDRILGLVEKCPKDLQAKCFELLLSGYVQAQIASLQPRSASGQEKTLKNDSGSSSEQTLSHVPATVLPRFKTFAKRVSIPLEKLEALFDFSVDPFVFNAISVPGEKKADKTRRAALLVAGRSYFANGSWTADWAEVKAFAVDQNCYDTSNHATFLKQGAGSLFKAVESGKAIELASEGIKEAEKLIKQIGEADQA
jgi:hypothetical protein